MLRLKKIKKIYELGNLKVNALNGIDIEFRKSEFVSILGPSGCGKTTLLNIVGGLDRYTSGDLIINGRSTKEYKDKEWDNYRNHSVGFVFQSYNLIPHQTVLENVEIALTLSGVSKKERRQRAIKVLTKVGLKDKIKNKPSQLSGGQMQRVAIARALVNDPEIILADEPTGALDSNTSVQIMELLKEISKDKLIIMVTHNPELAEAYSTRIVKLLDGNLIDDSNPFKEEEAKNEKKLLSISKDENLSKAELKKKNKKKRMSFFTALSLSFKNLLTKKGRTILVSIAGSIGIIGISLILAISNGFSAYVDNMQKDTLSSYPVQLTNSSYDMASLMQIFMSNDSNETKHDNDKVYTKQELTDMLSKFNASSSKSDLKSFKSYIENEGKTEISDYTSAIQYVYNANINAYYNSDKNGLICANPTTIFSDTITNYGIKHKAELENNNDMALRYSVLSMMFGSKSTYYTNEFWSEMIDNQDLLKSQYELVGDESKWATEYNEVMIVVDKNNEISDYTLYGLGLLDQTNLEILLDNYINNKDSQPVNDTFEYSDLLSLDYKLILESDYFEKQGDGTYLDIRKLKTSNPTEYENKIKALYDTKAIPIKIAGLIREKENSSIHSINTCIAYTSALTKHIINANNNSEVVKAQLENNTTNILTGLNFKPESLLMEKSMALTSLGYADLDQPSGIYLYPINFEAKEKINSFINNYNASKVEAGEEDKVITFSDTIDTMMNSISTIISSITYVLIAFVGVSLVVSSIMIGIITYISVIERTKEIGILRSVGASKRDIKRVFNAESFIVGLSSGLLGILISVLLIIPINLILNHFTGLNGIASLPILGAAILVTISVVLTLIAGFIPARVAAKKDPVVALREN